MNHKHASLTNVLSGDAKRPASWQDDDEDDKSSYKKLKQGNPAGCSLMIEVLHEFL
jgi:hypothetical protein